MTEAAEVKVKLVVDSNSDKVTEDLKKGLDGVGTSATKAGSKIDLGLKSNLGSMASLGKAALGGLAGAAVLAGGAIVGAAYESAHAFMESAAQVKMLAGTLTMLNTNGASFGEIKKAAGTLKDELEEAAIAAGTLDDEAVNTFNNIIERGGKSVDQAMELTEQMLQAGRAIPGGAQALSESFEMVEMGIIRAKNPLVGMISATGMLKGNAKQVAAEMLKMDPEKRLALAEKAIGRMSEKMEKAPLSFGEMKKSLKVATDNVLEGAGEPMLKAFAPVYGKVRAFFLENREAVNQIGEQFGQTVGRVIEVAGPILDELFKAMKDNSGEFKKAFDDLYAPAKDLFKYIYENKGAFAATIVDVLKAIVGVAAKLMSAIVFVRDTILSVLGSISNAIPGLAKLNGEEKQGAITKKLGGEVNEAGEGRVKDSRIAALRSEFIAAGELAGNVADAGEQFDKAYRHAMDDHKATMDAVGQARDAAMEDDAVKYAAMFDVAAKANDKGAMAYVAQFLDGNVSLQNALVKSGPEIFKTGVDGFLQALSEMGKGDIADSLKKGLVGHVVGDVGKAQITQNFSGGITIKQDYRDQDPDRVAIVFRQDLGRHAANRLQAAGVGPFG